MSIDSREYTDHWVTYGALVQFCKARCHGDDAEARAVAMLKTGAAKIGRPMFIPPYGSIVRIELDGQTGRYFLARGES